MKNKQHKFKNSIQMFKNDYFDINLLKEKWQALQKEPNVFAYNLNVQKRKYLSGSHRIYMEYNPERTSLRRTPQTIDSLSPKFKDEIFNFTKIREEEHLQTVPFNGIKVSFIINKSPLTKYHVLICPDLKGRHGQRLTLDSLHFSLELMLNLKDVDKSFRIGYNSPGALASVNHLHLHLLQLEADLYVDHACLEHLFGGYVYRLAKDMPTEALCWLFRKTDTEAAFKTKLLHLFDCINWLCENKRPHNLFITKDYTTPVDVKLFLFAREDFCVAKNLNHYNLGSFELAGYATVGNPELYESLTEEDFLTRIRCETGAVFSELYDRVVQQENKN